MDCKHCRNELETYLFEPASAELNSSSVGKHLAECGTCRAELGELQRTMNLLDAWEVPEPSRYFDQKMAVMMREEQAKTPASWLEKIREHLLFNTGRQFRPMLAGALALVLVLGGGTFAGLEIFSKPATEVQASATVNDLQILDKNAQAIQQMDQLLQDDGDDSDANSQPAS